MPVKTDKAKLLHYMETDIEPTPFSPNNDAVSIIDGNAVLVSVPDTFEEVAKMVLVTFQSVVVLILSRKHTTKLLSNHLKENVEVHHQNFYCQTQKPKRQGTGKVFFQTIITKHSFKNYYWNNGSLTNMQGNLRIVKFILFLVNDAVCLQAITD
ncbi:hypothetical protein DPMN_113090 [Dreissena polymorpha]|uniref:Uncharacterized protein n=1 Tax=Dreissena polymorpha TaxID=45954 RepID=A0A9D4KHM2_DREPO|nr:hypothetical protein DPMN_113090 [Dreissena polymorpha]